MEKTKIRNLFLMIILILFSIPHFSFYKKNHIPVLITNDFGIVTASDIEEEICNAELIDFPPPRYSSPNYWHCYEPGFDYDLYCEYDGVIPEGESSEYGEFHFVIQSQGRTNLYWTRRNWDVEYCLDMVKDISKLLKNGPVCISARYAEEDYNGTNWIIDRVKNHEGDWSWFARYNEKNEPIFTQRLGCKAFEEYQELFQGNWQDY